MTGFDPATAFRLDGKVAAVTGGANGIGRGAAFALGRAGCRVQVLDRDPVSAVQTVESLRAEGIHAEPIQLDVTREAEVNAAFERIAERGLDVLVNSAGLAIRRPATELPLADWQKVIDVNITGTFLCSRAAARLMLPKKSGNIINLASIMGLSGGGLYPNISYQTSKGAIVNLTRALAIEWAPHIRVNALAPTWVNTDFVRPLVENPELLGRMKSMTPLGRIAEVDDVAGAILFLASPAAAMITGHILAVDGGFLAQ
jgi:NAD(P)-dependent dehydrogenase (short-subunit alcohol dehydrogenase family)